MLNGSIDYGHDLPPHEDEDCHIVSSTKANKIGMYRGKSKSLTVTEHDKNNLPDAS